ncbi:putative odorant receptor [Trypoxylus dichotomus]
MSKDLDYRFMSFNIAVLKFLGLWLEDEKQDDKLRYLKMLAISLVLSPTMILMQYELVAVLTDPTPDIVYRIQVILAEVCVFGATYMAICFVQNRSNIKDLVQSIETFSKYSELDLISVDKKATFFSKIVLGYSLSGMVIYTLSPLLSISSCERRKPQYKIDHGVPCGVIVPIRLPFRSSILPVFEFCIVNEVINGIAIVLVVVNITMMVCGLLEHAISQLKEVRACVLKISEFGDEDIAAAVKFMVEYHCGVIDFVEKLNKYFGSQLVLHFTLTSVVVSLLGFEILMVDDNRESVMYALHLIGWLIMLYTICYYGQLVIDESVGIAVDAYSTPWYNSPVEIQKQIKLVMLRAQKPSTLKAMKLGIMSHSTFLAVNYKFLTILQGYDSTKPIFKGNKFVVFLFHAPPQDYLDSFRDKTRYAIVIELALLGELQRHLTFKGILKYLGLWLEDDGRETLKSNIRACLILLSLLPIAMLIFGDTADIIDPDMDIVLKVQHLIASACIAGALYIALCFYHNRSAIKTLVDSIADFSQFSKLDIEMIDKKATFFSKVILAYTVGGVLVYTSLPLLRIPSCEMSESKYSKKHDIACGAVVPLKMVFGYKDSPYFELVAVFQIEISCVISIFIVNVTMLVCGLLEHAINQLKEVRKCMLTIGSSPLDKVDGAVKFAVRYHCKVIDFIDKLNDSFGSQLVMHVTLTSLVISLLGFVMLAARKQEFLMYTSHLIGWLIILYNICHYGQMLIDESIGVAEDAYATPWYNCPVRIQKDIKLIILRSQRPLVLKAMSLKVLSEPTFLGCIVENMSEQERYQFLSFNVNVLKFLNLWPEDNKYKKKLGYLRAVLVVTSAFPTVFWVYWSTMGITDHHMDIVQKIQHVLASSCIAGAFYIAICFYHNRLEIRSLVDSIADFSKFSNLDPKSVDKKAIFISKVLLAYTVIGMLIYIAFPLLSISSCEAKRSLYFEENGIPCGIILPVKLGFSYKESPAFQVVDFFQAEVGCLTSVFIVNMTMLVCGLLDHAINQLKEVRKCMVNIGRCPEREIVDALGFAVKYHCTVIDFIDQLNNCFGSQLVMHITLTSLVISLLSFTILIVNQTELIMYVSHLAGWLIILYNVCHHGQMLIDESLGVAEDAYSTPWYNYPVKIQKDIKLVVLRSQRPLTLKAMSLGILSESTFLGIISSAYSYFTLLLKMKTQ